MVGRVSWVVLPSTPVCCPYNPVRIWDRDGQHSGVFTYARLNATPWSTSWENTFGMSDRLNVEAVWSSLTITRTFGRLGTGSAPADRGVGVRPASSEIATARERRQ